MPSISLETPGHEPRLAYAASCAAHLKGVTYVLVQDRGS
jgi:hypothetical protein